MSLLFLGVYGFTNLHAETATHLYRFYFEWERSIPLIPEFILIYFSLNIFLFVPLIWSSEEEILVLGKRASLTILIAGLCFYFFPAPTAFIRQAAVPAWSNFFRILFELDRPFNTFPSLHISFSVLILITVWPAQSLTEKTMTVFWVFLICLSVLFTHQHHVLDIMGGAILAFASAAVFRNRVLERNHASA